MTVKVHMVRIGIGINNSAIIRVYVEGWVRAVRGTLAKVPPCTYRMKICMLSYIFLFLFFAFFIFIISFF